MRAVWIALLLAVPEGLLAEGLDPRFPGLWRTSHQAPGGGKGMKVFMHQEWDIGADGTYSYKNEGPFHPGTYTGVLVASEGKLDTVSKGPKIQGTYLFKDPDTLVLETLVMGVRNQSIWKRATPPGRKADPLARTVVGVGPGAGPEPAPVPPAASPSPPPATRKPDPPPARGRRDRRSRGP